MVRVTIEKERVRFEMLGMDKVWAFKSQLEIPFACIRGVRADPQVARHWWKGWRIPGTQIPGVITAGTYYQKGKRTFWDVHNAEKALVIELANHTYDQIIVEVEDPGADASRIQAVAIHSSP